MVKILFLEDHTSVRESVAIALEKMNPSLKIIQTGDFDNAMKILNENPEIQTAIIDLSLQAAIQKTTTGGGIEGLNSLSTFREHCPELNAVIYTMFSDANIIRQCFSVNIQGYVTKSSSITELCTCINTVVSGGTYFCREAVNVLSKNARLAPSAQDDNDTDSIFFRYKTLSPKEKEIFLLSAKGYSLDKIAEETQKKRTTVKNQRTAIYQKLNCSDRYDLSKAAQELGLI